MKIAIITSGFLPVPATKGGAVENLIENLLKENEEYDKAKFNIISVFDELACIKSKKYKKSTFIFIKINFLVKFIDKFIFFIAKNILKKENSHSYRYIIQRLYFLKKCSKILSKNDYNKIILENHPSMYLALKWKKNYKKYNNKYYYHCHNEFPSTYGCDQIIKNTNKIICVSDFRKKNVEKYLKIKKDIFCVVKNGIDINKIAKKPNKSELTEIKNKYNIKKNDRVIIFTGRIVPGKGIEELISSLKLINDKRIKLLIVGAPLNEIKVKTKFEDNINKMIDDDIKNQIIFTGFVNYNELYKYYSLANIAVLPSIIEDSAPLTIIEALVCGIPIITTNSGGIPEYAVNNSAIILKRDSDLICNLSKEINNLIFDDNKIRKMSNNSLDASKEYTSEKNYINFINAIK